MKSGLKVHLVWIPKYGKAVLTGDMAIRVRDLLREIDEQEGEQIADDSRFPIDSP